MNTRPDYCNLDLIYCEARKQKLTEKSDSNGRKMTMLCYPRRYLTFINCNEECKILHKSVKTAKRTCFNMPTTTFFGCRLLVIAIESASRLD